MKTHFRWQQAFCHGKAIQHVNILRMSDLAVGSHFRSSDPGLDLFLAVCIADSPWPKLDRAQMSIAMFSTKIQFSYHWVNKIVSGPGDIFQTMSVVICIWRFWTPMTLKPWWDCNIGISLYLPSKRWTCTHPQGASNWVNTTDCHRSASIFYTVLQCLGAHPRYQSAVTNLSLCCNSQDGMDFSSFQYVRGVCAVNREYHCS